MAKDWQDRPIPRRPDAPTSLAYAEVPVDLSDPRSGEPLVDLADYGVAGQGYYARTDGQNPPYYRAFDTAHSAVRNRKSVAERLRAVNESLVPFGAELFALNGFRPVSLQRELWDFFIAQADVALSNPNEAERVAFAATYCSDPRQFDPADSRTWPVHATGGAIDITLRSTQTGQPLFMGGNFDDPSAISHTASLEAESVRRGGANKFTESECDALRNRRLLYWAMAEQDFTNYAYEWWHFDWGTQLWAIEAAADNDGAPRRAWYGLADASRA
ncbi:MAG: hypothetical protein MJE12_30655 [Alphaproteobacteria bacterium]|nr:hypothetical protein [Alphaproteobacteria bacterium]